MATIVPTTVDTVYKSVKRSTWENISENDVCEPIENALASEKSVQFNDGTYGSGSISLLGSINGTDYEILNDTENDPIAPTGRNIFTIRDNVIYVKPGVPAGTNVSVTVSLLHKEVT